MKYLNTCHFKEAHDSLNKLLETLREGGKPLQTFLVKSKISKMAYLKGDYLAAQKDAEAFIEYYESEKNEDANLVYLYFKALLLKAKVLHKIKDYVKAEEMIDEIYE
jgi:hypothetical protein